MITNDLILLIAFGVFSCFMWYTTHKTQVLLDRSTDKVLAERNPVAFSTYGATSPTVKEEQFHAPGNGKVLARSSGGNTLPSYLEEIE
jgi:hypothetical protein